MEEKKELAKIEEPIKLTVDEVKKYIAPNATDQELYFFMNIAKSYNLNPFKREIHFVKYGNSPGQVIVGYEMYLKRAERTGLLDGWEVVIHDKGKPTERAVITIWRKDRSKPFVWEVFRSEFDKKQSTWKTMPTFMLKKVAIAQGFRLAFPEDLGGMPYIPEELPNGNNTGITSEFLQQPKASEPEPPNKEIENNTSKTQPVSAAQKRKLFAMMSDRGLSKEEAKEFYHWFGATSKEQASDLIEHFDDYLALWQKDQEEEKEKESDQAEQQEIEI